MDRSTIEREPHRAAEAVTVDVDVRDGRVPASSRTEAETALTVDAGDLAAAAAQLASHAPDGTPLALRLTAGGLELTVRAEDHPVWETAVLPVDACPRAATSTCRVQALRAGAERLAAERSTVELTMTAAGRVRVEGVDLPAAEVVPPAPRRPTARGLVEQRIELPASLPEGVPIRVPGMAVRVPSAVTRRMRRNGIRLVSAFECEDGWYLSGVAQGRPMFAVVGAITVY